ncbi:HAD-like domain-containing protein [Schizophyllum commune]
MAKLTDHKVIIFDVYSTIVDWYSAIYNNLQPLLERYEVSSKWTRQEALDEYAAIEIDTKKRYPDKLYHRISEISYAELENKIRSLEGHKANLPDLSTEEERRAFGRHPVETVPFPDSVDALRRLGKHFKLTVLSNIDHESFAHTHHRISAADEYPNALQTYSYPAPNSKKYWYPHTVPGSKSPFTLVLTGQDVGAYKPDHKGFNIAFSEIENDPDLLGGSGLKAKEHTLIVANGLPGNIAPAPELGVRSVFIDRNLLGDEKAASKIGGKKWTWKFDTLGELADAVEGEVASK